MPSPPPLPPFSSSHQFRPRQERRRRERAPSTPDAGLASPKSSSGTSSPSRSRSRSRTPPHKDRIPGQPTLPLTYSTAHEFLTQELNVSRLDEIGRHLWVAGRPGHFRPLHRQRMLRREVIVTESADLHLCWFDDVIYVKPMVEALLDYRVWEEVICRDGGGGDGVDAEGVERGDGEGAGERRWEEPLAGENLQNGKTKGRVPETCLYKWACGFLNSYTELIIHASDYRIAVTTGLLPDVGFPAWKLFAQDVRARLAAASPGDLTLPPVQPSTSTIASPTSQQPSSHRWTYGELRLTRLNWIYKLSGRGYSYFYLFTDYGAYFSNHFRVLVLVLAWGSVSLTAMQVVLATERVPRVLDRASFVFGVVVLWLVLGVAVVMVGLLAFLVTYHCVATVVAHRRGRGRRQIP